MSLPAIYLNDRDLTGVGFFVSSIQGLRDGASMRYAVAAAPGMAGNLLLSPQPQMGSRIITVNGYVRAASAAGLVAIYDELQERLQAGDIEVRTIDQPDRVLVCRYRDRTLTPLPPQFVSRIHQCAFTLEAPDPLWYDRDPIQVSAAATLKVRCPIGTAPVWPVLQIMGAASNPVITLRNAAGDVVTTMTLTVTLNSTDYLVIDCGAGTITKYASGVATDGLPLLTAGDFPVLSPEDADFVTAAYPTLEVSAGTLLGAYHRGYA